MSERRKSRHLVKANYLKSDEWLDFKDVPELNGNIPPEIHNLQFKIDKKYVKAIDSEVDKGKYLNRSDFLRELVRQYFLKEK